MAYVSVTSVSMAHVSMACVSMARVSGGQFVWMQGLVTCQQQQQLGLIEETTSSKKLMSRSLSFSLSNVFTVLDYLSLLTNFVVDDVVVFLI